MNIRPKMQTKADGDFGDSLDMQSVISGECFLKNSAFCIAFPGPYGYFANARALESSNTPSVPKSSYR